MLNCAQHISRFAPFPTPCPHVEVLARIIVASPCLSTRLNKQFFFELYTVQSWILSIFQCQILFFFQFLFFHRPRSIYSSPPRQPSFFLFCFFNFFFFRQEKNEGRVNCGGRERGSGVNLSKSPAEGVISV